MHLIEGRDKPKKNVWQSACFYIEFKQKSTNINMLVMYCSYNLCGFSGGILLQCIIAVTFVQQISDGTQYWTLG